MNVFLDEFPLNVPYRRKIVEELINQLPINTLHILSWEATSEHTLSIPLYRQDMGFFKDLVYLQNEIDWSQIDPLDPSLIHRMLSYESIALDMMDRFFANSNITLTYENRRLLYYLNLRYWAHYLRKHKISIFISAFVPHQVVDYIIYGLCRVRGILTLCAYQTQIATRVLLVENYEDAVDGLQSRLHELLKTHDKTVSSVLAADLEYHYRAYGGVTGDRVPPGFLGETLPVSRRLYMAGLKIYQHPELLWKRGLNPFFWLKKIKIKIQKKYQKLRYLTLCRPYDLNQKFIFLGLHYHPEMSSEPLGGVFHDENLVIDILLSALPENVYLYIKEHPRVNDVANYYPYFKKIANHPRVRFIDRKTSSFELIKCSMAVATLTGTCGWEALLRGKPVLVFGYPFYQYAVGAHRIHSLSDCRHAIEKILKHQEYPNEWTNRLFLLALQQVAPHAYMDLFYQKIFFAISPNATELQIIVDLVKAMVDFIRAHLNHD